MAKPCSLIDRPEPNGSRMLDGYLAELSGE
jgi:hypothetical protein